MKALTFLRYSACAGAFALAACGTTVPPQPALRSSAAKTSAVQLSTKGFFDRTALAKPKLFVSIESSNVVDVFLQASPNKLVGQITGLNSPTGLATDAAGDVFVANYNAPIVPAFAPPYTNGPKITLLTPGYLPYAVAVSQSGMVAVLMSCNTISCPIGYALSFYNKGATRRCKTVSAGTFPNVPIGIAFDKAGAAFVAGQNKSGPYIGEITGGCHASGVTALTAGNTLYRLFDVHVNKQNQLAFLDTDAGYIYTYNLPKNGSLGNPLYSTDLGNPEDGFNFTFLASGTRFYSNLNGTNITKFDYPSGSVVGTLNVPNAGDVAVTPPLIP